MEDLHRTPVATVRDLDTLDGTEILEGYMDGLKNEPCGGNRSRAFWHGWRNGQMDKGHLQHDAASRALAHEVVARSRDGAPSKKSPPDFNRITAFLDGLGA